MKSESAGADRINKPAELFVFVLFTAILSFAVIKAFFLNDNPGGVPVGAEAGRGYYRFAENLDGAVVKQAYAELSAGAMEIKGLRLRSIYAHPPSELVFEEITIRKNSRLEFYIGIKPGAWDKEGDGVRFIVCIDNNDGDTVKLFDKYINPKNNEKHRRWHFEEVILPLSGGIADVRLLTDPGPRNDLSGDWAFWGEPVLVSGTKI